MLIPINKQSFVPARYMSDLIFEVIFDASAQMDGAKWFA